MEINFLFDSFQFNFLLFFILIGIAYLFSRFLGFKSFTSVIGFHSVLIAIFSIIGVIDYMFLVFALIEIIILIKIGKTSGSDENTSN